MISYFNLLSTPHPEGNALLEIIIKIIGLPVLDIVRELKRISQYHDYFGNLKQTFNSPSILTYTSFKNVKSNFFPITYL